MDGLDVEGSLTEEEIVGHNETLDGMERRV